MKKQICIALGLLGLGSVPGTCDVGQLGATHWELHPDREELSEGIKLSGPLTFTEDHFAAPDLDKPYLDEGFDTDCVVLPSELIAEAGRFQPMIQEGATGYVPSAHFTELANQLAIINQLTYARGQSYRYGHELTYTDSLAGWTFRNIGAVRGYVAGDPNAGVVGYHKALNTIVVALHGSINTADWITNFGSEAVRFDAMRAPDGTALALVGRAHGGFLHKYLSCRTQIMNEVDKVLAALTPEEKGHAKFYVTGHSQAAGLGQILFGDLCQHLRKHFPDFNNAKENRVHAWLLSSPVALDATAKAFVEGIGGRLNIVVQNTWLDPVPNVGVTRKGFELRPVGTPVMQSMLEAMARAGEAHGKAAMTHAANGDYKEALRGAGAPLRSPAAFSKAMIAAAHMASDNVNYRGVGSSYAFDPDMVVKEVAGITEGLQMAFDYRQDQLRAKALLAGAAAPAKAKLTSAQKVAAAEHEASRPKPTVTSAWGYVKSFWN